MALNATLCFEIISLAFSRLCTHDGGKAYDEPMLINPKSALIMPVNVMVQSGMTQRESIWDIKNQRRISTLMS